MEAATLARTDVGALADASGLDEPVLLRVAAARRRGFSTTSADVEKSIDGAMDQVLLTWLAC